MANLTELKLRGNQRLAGMPKNSHKQVVGGPSLRRLAKGTSPQGEAESSDAPPRDGPVRSSVETAVMAVERRGGVIRGEGMANRASGRSLV